MIVLLHNVIASDRRRSSEVVFPEGAGSAAIYPYKINGDSQYSTALKYLIY